MCHVSYHLFPRKLEQEIHMQFDFLVVLHLCGAGSDLEASQEIAQAGKGVCLQVEKFEDLPQRLYESLRMLSRR